MDNKTACAILKTDETVSMRRLDFICMNDEFHQAMLSSPWPVLFYAASVLFIAWLVKRTADNVHRYSRMRQENTPDKQQD